MYQFDQEMVQSQVEAVSQGQCKKCNSLVLYTVEQHNSKHNPGTDLASCVICSEKLIQLATLHLNVHFRPFSLIKCPVEDNEIENEIEQVKEIVETDNVQGDAKKFDSINFMVKNDVVESVKTIQNEPMTEIVENFAKTENIFDTSQNPETELKLDTSTSISH